MHPLIAPGVEHTIDAAPRGGLFWDVMRQRGGQYREQRPQTAPSADNG